MRVLFSDIETTKFKDDLSEFETSSYELEFKLGCILEFDFENENLIESYYSFNHNEYLFNLCSGLSRRKRKIVYFHNLTFDSKFIIDYLNETFDIVKVIRTNSDIISIKCFKSRIIKRIVNKKEKELVQNDCLLELRDSLSILLVSIDSLGKMVNVNKLDFDFNYDNKEKAIDYCFNDCFIIYKSLKYLLDFLNDFFDLGYEFKDLPLTIATLSKRLITLFYPNSFFKVDKYFERTIRKYYFGGRTESFNFNLLKNGKYLDVNSLYPFVLSNYEFGIGKSIQIYTDKIDLSNNVLGYELIIKENQFYPLFPERNDNKIYFMNGIKTVFMSKYEYNYLVDNNYIPEKIRIEKVISVFYNNNISNFSMFFKNLYYIRKSYDSEHNYNYILKILMNSGYGKFAERIEKETYEFINNFDNLDFEKETIIDDNSILLRVKKKTMNFMKINLINAILTTNYARFELWKMLENCRLNNIPVYYVDTDSIVVGNNNLEKLESYIDDFHIGKWKIEKSFDYFQCIDSKEYYTMINENGKSVFKAKFKGVSSKNYLKDLDSIKNHIEKGTKVNLIGSFFYCIKRHSPNNSVFVIEKHKISYFKKREITENLTTIPLDSFDYIDDIENSNKDLIQNQLEKNFKLLSK